MAALVAAIGTFFSGVMGMVSTLTTTIVGDDLLVLGIPLTHCSHNPSHG